jgi:predicted dienelactone hydrolase
MANKYWSCLIGGEVVELPSGADLPLRQSVKNAYLQLTGEHDEVCSSGWGIDEERYHVLIELQSLSTFTLKEMLDKRSRTFTLKKRN